MDMRSSDMPIDSRSRPVVVELLYWSLRLFSSSSRRLKRESEVSGSGRDRTSKDVVSLDKGGGTGFSNFGGWQVFF